MTPEQLDDMRKRLDAREVRIAAAEKLLERREQNLLDEVTQQAICLVLLRKLRDRGWLKPSDLNEIEHAARLQETDDYRPAQRLSAILRETALDREAKRTRPD